MNLTTTTITKKPISASIFATALAGLMLFGACKQEDAVFPDQAVFSITNASASFPKIDFILNEAKVPKANPLIFGDNTGYYATSPGLRTGSVRVPGGTNNLFSNSMRLDKDFVYSVYVVDSTENLLTFIKTLDNYQYKNPGVTLKPQLRFLNLSKGAPALDLVYEGDTATFNNNPFKKHTGFKFVPAKKDIILKLRNTATNEIVATLPKVELKDNEIYSVWAKGPYVTTSADTTQKLVLKLTRHTNALR